MPNHISPLNLSPKVLRKAIIASIRERYGAELAYYQEPGKPIKCTPEEFYDVYMPEKDKVVEHKITLACLTAGIKEWL